MPCLDGSKRQAWRNGRSYQGQCRIPWIESGPILRTGWRYLEDVLGGVAAEHHFLQHSLVRRIHRINGLALLRLLFQRNQRALYLELILASVAAEHHYMFLARHGMAHGILTRRQYSASDASGDVKFDVVHIANSQLVSCRHRDDSQCKKQNA